MNIRSSKYHKRPRGWDVGRISEALLSHRLLGPCIHTRTGLEAPGTSFFYIESCSRTEALQLVVKCHHVCSFSMPRSWNPVGSRGTVTPVLALSRYVTGVLAPCFPLGHQGPRRSESLDPPRMKPLRSRFHQHCGSRGCRRAAGPLR